MKIYFAGSIRGGRDDQNIYFELIKILSQYGTVLTEHVGRADLTARGEDALSDKYIYERDIEWIEECDFVVAEVTKVSLGVGYEIGYAESKAKKILCL
jgi:nucleoside 2-deoxyribosyltransferase